MRKIIAFSFFNFILNVSSAQVSAYTSEKFNIRPVSTDVLNIINRQLKISDGELLKAQKNLNFKITDKNIAEKLASQFNVAYEATLNDIKKYDFLAAIPQYVEKVGLPSLRLNTYNNLPLSLQSYLPPVVKYNAAFIYKQYCSDIIENSKEKTEEIKSIVLKRFLIIKSLTSSLELNAINEFSKFKEKFCHQYGNLDSLMLVQDLMFKRNVNNLIAEYAFKIRDQYKSITSGATDINTEITSLKRSLTSFQEKIDASIKNEIDNVEKSIERLYNNQQRLDSLLRSSSSLSLSNHLKGLKENTIKIENDLKNKAEEFRKQGSASIKAELDKLKKQYDNARQKISAVTTLVDNLVTGKFSVKDGFEYLQDAAVKEILGTDIKTLEKSFNSVFKNDLSQQDNAISTLSNVGYTLSNNLAKLGIISSEDAQKVATFIKYASSAITIGCGIGEMFVNPIAGLTKIFKGISSLFGGDSETEEEKMFKKISEQLGRIEKEIETINKNLIQISKQIEELHKDMDHSFNQVFYMLRVINYKLDNIQELARLQVYNEFNSCDNFINDSVYSKLKFESWDNYLDNHVSETGVCLEGLNKFSITKDEGYFYLATSTPLEDEEKARHSVLDVYNWTYKIYKDSYATNKSDKITNNSLNALMLPVHHTTDINLPYYYASNSYSELNFTKIQQLFNAPLVIQYTKLFNKLSVYFEISLHDPSFYPAKIDEFLGGAGEKSWTQSQRAIKNQLQRSRVQKILNITNKSIIQQNLISGGLILNDVISQLESCPGEEGQLLVRNNIINIDSALYYNKYLATNLATKILSNEFSVQTRSSKVFYDTVITKSFIKLQDLIDSTRMMYSKTVAENSSKLSLDALVTLCKRGTLVLDSLIKSNGNYILNFDFEYDTLNICNKIKITPKGYLKDSKPKSIILDIPPTDLILNDLLVYPNELYELLEVKNKLKDKLVALTFNEKLPRYSKANHPKRGIQVMDREAFKLVYGYKE